MLRTINNTLKHVSRSGWIGWGSVLVMTLAFLVVSIFGGLAYISNLYIQFIEQKSNLLVFFEVDYPEDEVIKLKDKWANFNGIKNISYTSEKDAFNLYSDFTQIAQPQIYEVLKLQEEKKLPSSLDIQINSLDNLKDIREYIQKEVDITNENLKIILTSDLKEEIKTNVTEKADNIDITLNNEEKAENITTNQEPSDKEIKENQGESTIIKTETPPTIIPKYKYSKTVGEPPIQLKVDDENLEQMKEAFGYLRIGGIVAISLLLLVVFVFTFMTVEFRLYNQTEEIGVMQLVGGSLGYIRAPYILEGGLYGFLGAVISNSILTALLASLIYYPKETGLYTVTQFLYQNLNFSNLPWPQIGIYEFAIAFSATSLFGFLVGAISSFLSIRRYIR